MKGIKNIFFLTVLFVIFVVSAVILAIGYNTLEQTNDPIAYFIMGIGVVGIIGCFIINKKIRRTKQDSH